MRIEYNGNLIETNARNIAEFLDEQGIDADSVAAAVDGRHVPRARHANEPLTAGARLEVLSAMQGG